MVFLRLCLLETSIMSITPLPEATTRLLGSSQCITTPTSLVKELLDNSLDARATSIDILISQNTLDTIEVRDNGHGIAADDLDSLGKNGRTSKLRKFEDLVDIGGSSLGFRGQALASAVQLGEVSVTTRTDGEPVAIVAELQAFGGALSQARTSHPVGTTISVVNLMTRLPVRRKVLLKEAPKSLIKIKELLQSYSLARPSIRFSLKVAKGKNGGWSFAPRRNDGIKEAVSQVIGRDTAMQCFEKLWLFSESREVLPNETSESGAPGAKTSLNGLLPRGPEDFLIEAFMPRSDADVSKIGGHQFLSIDSRPVSHEKGTMKVIYTLFKKYIQNIVPESLPGKISQPFLRLNLICPTGSYDPNVEPAKDEVLFGNDSIIIKSAEALFKEVYGERNITLSNHPPKRANGFEILLARKAPKLTSADDDFVSQETRSTSRDTSSPVPVQALTDQFSTDQETLAGSPEKLGSAEKPNPTQAKLVPSIETDVATDVEEGNLEYARKQKRSWDVNMSNDHNEDIEDFSTSPRKARSRPFETPDGDTRWSSASSVNPWVIAKRNKPSQDSEYPVTPRVSLALPSTTFAASLNRIADNEVSTQDAVSPRQQRSLIGFITARNLVETSLPSPPTTIERQGESRVSSGPRRPFQSPLRTVQDAHREHNLVQTRLAGAPVPADTLEFSPEPPLVSDIEWAMDFETRKDARREELRRTRTTENRPPKPTSERTSPHKNRYNAAIAAIEASQPSAGDEPLLEELARNRGTAFLDEADPDAHPISQRTSTHGSHPKLRRVKSRAILLTMKAIPNGKQLHDLVQVIPTTLEVLRRATMMMPFSEDDLYDHIPANLSMSDLSGNSAVSDRTQALVMTWLASEDGKKYELERFTFENLFEADIGSFF